MKLINRVKHNLDFDRIIQNGRNIKEDIIFAYYLKTPGPLRVGIAVSKKIGNAVVRNKIKRQIRAIMIKKVEQYDGIEIVIIVRPKFLQTNFEKKQLTLTNLMVKTEK